MSHPFGDKFYKNHWSPSALNQIADANFFLTELKAKGRDVAMPAAVTTGRAVEAGAAAQLVAGLSGPEAHRCAMAELDTHILIPWDTEADTARLEANRDVLDTMVDHAIEGISTALSGANIITGQERLTKKYPGVLLPLLGYSDFEGGGVGVELKTRTSAFSEKSKNGRRAGPLPSKPDFNHILQCSAYSNMHGGKPWKLVYVSEKGFVIFDETNCPELTPDAIKNNVEQLLAVARARENLMRRAPDMRTLLQMISPNFQDFGWNIDPQLKAEAMAIWGVTA